MKALDDLIGAVSMEKWRASQRNFTLWCISCWWNKEKYGDELTLSLAPPLPTDPVGFQLDVSASTHATRTSRLRCTQFTHASSWTSGPHFPLSLQPAVVGFSGISAIHFPNLLLFVHKHWATGHLVLPSFHSPIPSLQTFLKVLWFSPVQHF